jgi:hypothetical protein
MSPVLLPLERIAARAFLAPLPAFPAVCLPVEGRDAAFTDLASALDDASESVTAACGLPRAQAKDSLASLLTLEHAPRYFAARALDAVVQALAEEADADADTDALEAAAAANRVSESGIIDVQWPRATPVLTALLLYTLRAYVPCLDLYGAEFQYANLAADASIELPFCSVERLVHSSAFEAALWLAEGIAPRPSAAAMDEDGLQVVMDDIEQLLHGSHNGTNRNGTEGKRASLPLVARMECPLNPRHCDPPESVSILNACCPAFLLGDKNSEDIAERVLDFDNAIDAGRASSGYATRGAGPNEESLLEQDPVSAIEAVIHSRLNRAILRVISLHLRREASATVDRSLVSLRFRKLITVAETNIGKILDSSAQLMEQAKDLSQTAEEQAVRAAAKTEHVRLIRSALRDALAKEAENNRLQRHVNGDRIQKDLASAFSLVEIGSDAHPQQEPKSSSGRHRTSQYSNPAGHRDTNGRRRDQGTVSDDETDGTIGPRAFRETAHHAAREASGDVAASMRGPATASVRRPSLDLDSGRADNYSVSVDVGSALKPVFGRGLQPLPGMKRSAWFDINAQVEVKKKEDKLVVDDLMQEDGTIEMGPIPEAENEDDDSISGNSDKNPVPMDVDDHRVVAIDPPVHDVPLGLPTVSNKDPQISMVSEDNSLMHGVRSTPGRTPFELISTPLRSPDNLPEFPTPATLLDMDMQNTMIRMPNQVKPGSFDAAVMHLFPDSESDPFAVAQNNLPQRSDLFVRDLALSTADPVHSSLIRWYQDADEQQEPGVSSFLPSLRQRETMCSVLRLPLSEVLRRSIATPLFSQHKLISRAAVSAIMEQMALLDHLWSVRAVFLLEQAQTMFSFLSDVFRGVGDTRFSNLDLKNNVQGSYRLTESLRESLGYLSRRQAKMSVDAHALMENTALNGHADPTLAGRLDPSLFTVSYVGLGLTQPADLLERGIRINYSAPSPVSLLLDKAALDVYNRVFGRLLHIKHITASLEAFTFSARKLQSSMQLLFLRTASRIPAIALLQNRLHTVSIYRRFVLQVVRAMHDHIQLAIIQEPWRRLTEAVRGNRKTLSELHAAHNNYLRIVQHAALVLPEQRQAGLVLERMLGRALAIVRDIQRFLDSVQASSMRVHEFIYDSVVAVRSLHLDRSSAANASTHDAARGPTRRGARGPADGTSDNGAEDLPESPIRVLQSPRYASALQATLRDSATVSYLSATLADPDRIFLDIRRSVLDFYRDVQFVTKATDAASARAGAAGDSTFLVVLNALGIGNMRMLV